MFFISGPGYTVLECLLGRGEATILIRRGFWGDDLLPDVMPCRWVLARAKQLSMAAIASVIWLCAGVNNGHTAESTSMLKFLLSPLLLLFLSLLFVSSNSVCNHRVINKIGQPRSRSPICLHNVAWSRGTFNFFLTDTSSNRHLKLVPAFLYFFSFTSYNMNLNPTPFSCSLPFFSS